MRICEIIIREQATAGATSAGNIASVVKKDGTAKGAHNLPGVSLFGGPGFVRR